MMGAASKADYHYESVGPGIDEMCLDEEVRLGFRESIDPGRSPGARGRLTITRLLGIDDRWEETRRSGVVYRDDGTSSTGAVHRREGRAYHVCAASTAQFVTRSSSRLSTRGI